MDGMENEHNILANEDTQAIPERSNYKRFFLDLSRSPLLRFGLQCKTNVELYTRATSHLGHSVSVIDVIHNTLYE